jgi:hypothetical protein
MSTGMPHPHISTLVPVAWGDVPPDMRPMVWPFLCTSTGVSWWDVLAGPTYLPIFALTDRWEHPPWLSPRISGPSPSLLWLAPPTLDVDVVNAQRDAGAPKGWVPLTMDWCTAHYGAQARQHGVSMRWGERAAVDRTEWLEGAVHAYSGLVLDDAPIGRGAGEIGYRFTTLRKPVYWRDRPVVVTSQQGSDGRPQYQIEHV